MSADSELQNRDLPLVATVLEDPAASFWLKVALQSGLARDPVDAADDAQILFRLLDDRCRLWLDGRG